MDVIINESVKGVYMKREQGWLNHFKQAQVVVLLGVMAIVAIGLYCTRIEHHANYDANFYTTTYAGTLSIPVDCLDVIRQEYGEEGVSLYIEAVQTGDYYKYRSFTGFWQPSKQDPKLKQHAIQNIAAPLFFLQDRTHDIEAFVYDYLGAYATMADYVAICQQYGVAAFSSTYKTGNDLYAQYVEGTMPKTGTKITKQQYLANHSNVATTTATSSNSAVEALKTYSGNTSEFNAYTYYTRYADLQSAVGANGDALLKHWQAYGKAEGRIAN